MDIKPILILSQVLGKYWASIGQVLGKYWASIRQVLGNTPAKGH
jgi:hypothetical protein